MVYEHCHEPGDRTLQDNHANCADGGVHFPADGGDGCHARGVEQCEGQEAGGG